MNKIFFAFSSKLWEKYGESYITGYAFIDDKLYRGESLLSALTGLSSKDVLVEHLKKLNGVWAFCFKIDQHNYLIAVDRVNNRQVFWGERKGELIISDNAEAVRLFVGDTELDPVACEEFVNSRLVSGNSTLYKNVKQSQAGECLFVRLDENGNPHIEPTKWFVFAHKEPSLDDHAAWNTEILLEELDNRNFKSFKRLIEYADGREIIIPLSGGYDSRTVALTLKRLGVTKLKAFSYGGYKNQDPLVARKIASQLGIEWEYVPYTKKLWQDVAKTSEFQKYLHNTHEYSAISHIQEFPAVFSLRHSGYFGKDPVVVPGHTDYLLGNVVPPDLQSEYDFNALYHYLLKYFFNFESGKVSQETSEHIKRHFVELVGESEFPLTQVEFSRCIEQWGWHEAFCKFNINMSKVYETFGIDFYMPSLDISLFDFWLRVPISIKRKRGLQMKYLEKFYSNYTKCPPQDALISDRERINPSVQIVSYPKFRHSIPAVVKYAKRYYEMHKNVWGWHYAFSAKERIELAKRGSLAITNLVAHSILNKIRDEANSVCNDRSC